MKPEEGRLVVKDPPRMGARRVKTSGEWWSSVVVNRQTLSCA